MAVFLQLLVKFMPMILSIISALIGGGTALQSHMMLASAAPGTYADNAWWTHVGGYGGGGGALALLFASLQPVASRAIERLQFEQQLEAISKMTPEQKARIIKAAS